MTVKSVLAAKLSAAARNWRHDKAQTPQQLETDAGAWHRARHLRRYIRAARKAVGANTIRARFRDQHIDYLDWAEAYVDRLDPLTSRPRSLEFSTRTVYFVSDLDRLKADIGRLFGSEWPSSWKFGADYSPDPTRRYYYQARSVFEVEDADEGLRGTRVTRPQRRTLCASISSAASQFWDAESYCTLSREPFPGTLGMVFAPHAGDIRVFAATV